MRMVILSGLSGSGKSVALNMLEDLGYYCIDNLPAGLLGTLAERTVASGDPAYERLAVGIDARNRPEDIASVPDVVKALRADGIRCEVVFLHANHGTLLQRYSETRRKHPLSSDQLALAEAIERERRLLEPVAAAADMVIDSTKTSVHELRELVRNRVHETASTMSVLFKSFGYKNGLPVDADFVFDVRCLPNPYWVQDLKDRSGLDPEVIDYLAGHDEVGEMYESIASLLERWLPEFMRSNRSYTTVAIGCTGGRHRSVYIVERLADRFRTSFEHVLTRHSELDPPTP